MATFEAVNSENQLIIKIIGDFIFNDRKKFIESYENITNIENKNIIVDFTNTTFLDSTALAMLLMLRECCGGDNSKITLVTKHNKNITKIISVINFAQIFTII